MIGFVTTAAVCSSAMVFVLYVVLLFIGVLIRKKDILIDGLFKSLYAI